MSVVEGVKYFLNLKQPEQRYRLIVGSYKNQTDAALKAEQIRKEDSALNVYVGQRMPDNQFFPVIIGDYIPLSDALKLQEKALSLKSVEGAYLSPFTYR